jgi:hypothetical protein
VVLRFLSSFSTTAMVLDPLSAIGLAGNIVQFIDFSFSIISESCEIYRSADGACKETLELLVVVQDLKQLIDPIQKAPQNAYPKDAFSKVLFGCNDVATDLLDLINKIKGGNSSSRAWKSVRQAIVASIKKDKRLDLEGRLVRLRQQLGFHIQLMIRYVMLSHSNSLL